MESHRVERNTREHEGFQWILGASTRLLLTSSGRQEILQNVTMVGLAMLDVLGTPSPPLSTKFTANLTLSMGGLCLPPGHLHFEFLAYG